MYVHSNKILIMEFSAGFKNFLVQNAVAQKLLSILIFTTITNNRLQLDILYRAIKTMFFAGLDQSTIVEYK